MKEKPGAWVPQGEQEPVEQYLIEGTAKFLVELDEDTIREADQKLVLPLPIYSNASPEQKSAGIQYGKNMVELYLRTEFPSAEEFTFEYYKPDRSQEKQE